MEHRPLRIDAFGLGNCPDANTAQIQNQLPQQSRFSNIDTSSDFRTRLSAPSNEQRAASRVVEWEGDPSSESATPTSQECRPLSGTRRIACVESSTEEQTRHFGPSERADSRIDSRKGFVDRRMEKVSFLTSINGETQSSEHDLSLSLYGLSLDSEDVEYMRSGPSCYGSEVVSRRSDNSPVLSAESSLTFRSPILTTSESDTKKKLSKSAKKRMKKKQKRQEETTWPKFPCIHPSGSPPEEGDASMDAKHAQMTSIPSKMPHQLSALLGDSVPETSLRFREQGIRNLGNTCFLGSAMQFLLASSQFCWLMTEMKTARYFLDKSLFPVVCSMGSLANVLSVQPANQFHFKSARESRNYGDQSRLYPVAPDMLSSVVSMFQSRFSEERKVGGQDVQEYMLFVLDQIEKEIVHIRHLFEDQQSSNREHNDVDDGWMFVGKKNKVSIRRTTGVTETSILSSIFGGYVQSAVRATGMTASVTTHAFTTLILDIAHDNVRTVEDALDMYTARDNIHDYRVQNSDKRVVATKNNLFQQLPPFLIVCLKQYTYTQSGFEKIDKRIGFETTLEFKKSWLSDAKKQLKYKLVATCNHHGRGYGGDHYTANVVQWDGNWIHFNDSTIKRTGVMDVLSETPYLLMYEQL